MRSSQIDHAAVISGSRALTHAQLDLAARRTTTVLQSIGVSRGDIIALLARNGFGYFVFSEAVRYLGALITPVNWHLRPPEVEYILDDCDAKVVISHSDLATPEMREAFGNRIVFIEPVASEIQEAYGLSSEQCILSNGDVALSASIQDVQPFEGDIPPPEPALFYTSGTTGHPKAVRRKPVTPEVQKSISERTLNAFGLAGAENPVSIMTGPLYHSAPNAYANIIVQSGGTIVLQPRFNPEELLKLIESERVTHLHMVPTMFQRLLNLPPATRSRHDLSSLKSVIHGAAACPPDVKHAMIDWWGPIICEYYAMTELGIIAGSSSLEWLAHQGSVGRAAKGVDIEIQNKGGEHLPPGAVGDICVHHAATKAFSYMNAEAKTNAMRRGNFVVTGDIGHLDEDGFLYISDRRSDMVISGGVNIYPAEIEAVLVNLPGLTDCAVFGVSDPEFGEKLVAVVSGDIELSDSEIITWLKSRIAGYKTPREIVFRKTIPREDSGKVKKRILKEDYLTQMGES